MKHDNSENFGIFKTSEKWERREKSDEPKAAPQMRGAASKVW
jgi:hypothetical protein